MVDGVRRVNGAHLKTTGGEEAQSRVKPQDTIRTDNFRTGNDSMPIGAWGPVSEMFPNFLPDLSEGEVAKYLDRRQIRK